jgi:hypothetical protein
MRVKFDESAKTFDGCSPKYLDMYKIIGSYFNVDPRYIRIGKSFDDIDKMIYYYTTTKPVKYSSLSDFLRLNIISRKFTKETLLPTENIRTSKDCIIASNGNIDVIKRCIDELKYTKLGVISKYEEKMDDHKLRYSNSNNEIDEEWDKTCNNYKCFDNKCCFSKKTLMRKSYNISLIRSGCRDYQLTLNIEYEYCINNLIKILQDALYELNKNNVINELHILHKKMIID